MNSGSPSVPAQARPVRAVWQLGLGLLLTPSAAAFAARSFPHWRLDAHLADATAFVGAALLPILGLTLCAMVEVRLTFALAAAAASATTLLAVVLFQPAPVATVLVVDSALVCLSWALGCSLGRRVQHAAHLLPACVVAASADLVSLLSPEGPSHEIAGSEQALSVLAVWFPVPGAAALAPALGVGDLLFMALALGVARKHSLPYRRCVLACVIGTAVAGAAAGWSGRAIPALIPIAAMLVLMLPGIRQLRRQDRAAARWSMLIAGAVALATIARALSSGR